MHYYAESQARRSVAVIGVPHDELGEKEVKAIVQLAPGLVGSEVLAAELIDYTRARIAPYEAPRSVDFVEELPRTPTGRAGEGQARETYGRVTEPAARR